MGILYFLKNQTSMKLSTELCSETFFQNNGLFTDSFAIKNNRIQQNCMPGEPIVKNGQS